MENKEVLDGAVMHDRDFEFDYFGFKTLEKSYLLKIDGEIAECPQHTLMRVAVGIHMEAIDSGLETYNLLSQRFFTHATPTLFNADTPNPQMSSCFLTCEKEDSIDGIYDTLKNCAVISKYAGGIGMSISNVRAPSLGELYPRYERHLQWHRACATCLQQYGRIRRSGGWKTQGQHCRVH